MGNFSFDPFAPLRPNELWVCTDCLDKEYERARRLCLALILSQVLGKEAIKAVED